MTTSEINAASLNLVPAQVCTEIVAAYRRKVERAAQPQRRIIAVGRSVNGGGFTVTAPVAPPQDFADAIDEVLTPGRKATVAMPAGAEYEHIGREISERPWMW